MRMNVNFFENVISIEDESIFALEIENKKYFYRFVQNIFKIYDDGFCDEIQFIDENNTEKTMNNKLKVFINFFNFEFDSKKYTTDMTKYVNDFVSEDDKNDLIKLYNKIAKLYNKVLNDIDLPLSVDNDVSIDSITKFMKVSISEKNDLLDNLLLLIDLERVLKTNNLLFFVNLKQYLTKDELIELYKYSIYNGVHIFLVDSQSYGVTLNYEKKLIIDDNLDEFML